MGRSAIVLAAGLGTRMKSKRHKVLHEVCGKSMISHILDELQKVDLQQIIVVVGQQREAVEAEVAGRAEIAVQEEQKGTGHAVQAAAPLLREGIDATVVLYGDAPLVRAETITQLFAEREQVDASACVLTATVANPRGLGRVLLDNDGRLVRIVEEKDASEQERMVCLINTGIYAFGTADLLRVLPKLQPNNVQGEYYLTDAVAILRAEGQRVGSLEAADPDEIASVNDRAQLAEVERLFRLRVARKWMEKGVTIVNPDNTYIGADVQIGQDTVLLPGTMLEGETSIGEDCVIGPNTRIRHSVIHDSVSIEQSVVLESEVGQFAKVGPFAYLRPESRVGPRVKIGDFVELKKTSVGEDSKISHLAYVGDADIGKRVNIGCGVITVNYDGHRKHRTVIGDDSFVGSNVNLIAPLNVGHGSYLCAGSTITDDVPDDGFAIARNRQVTKAEYVKSWRDAKNRDEEA